MAFGFGFGLPRGGNTIWSPASLFAQNEPGVWYDPSDMATLFQDAAGTTPVTAVEQPVGLMRDKSGNGNHATSLTTSRPVLTARVNLLTKTEQFDDAVWSKTNATVTANTTTAPDGTLTADKLVENTANGEHRVYQTVSLVTAAYTFSFYAKPAGRDWIWFYLNAGLQTGYVNIATGAIGTTFGSLTATTTNVGNGWYKIVVAYSNTTIGSQNIQIWAATGNGGDIYTGDGTSGIYLWGASLTTADQASLGYQRVNTATDYDTVGFPMWLKADGVDDYMVTGTLAAPVNLNLSSTDKVTVATGVRKLSDAARAVVVELSAGGNLGSFAFAAPSAVLAGYNFTSTGTIAANATSIIFVAPITNVLSGLGDISGDLATLRVNGTQVAQSTADQGTGNYGTYPLYQFRRAGTTLPFNGLSAGLTVVGRTLTAAELSQLETYYQQKTKAY